MQLRANSRERSMLLVNFIESSRCKTGVSVLSLQRGIMYRCMNMYALRFVVFNGPLMGFNGGYLIIS